MIEFQDLELEPQPVVKTDALIPSWLIHLSFVCICYSALIAALKIIAMLFVGLDMPLWISKLLDKSVHFPEYFTSLLDFGGPIFVGALLIYFQKRINKEELRGGRKLLGCTRWLLISMLVLCISELSLSLVIRSSFATDQVVLSQTLLTISMLFGLIVQALTFFMGLSIMKTFAFDPLVNKLGKITFAVGATEVCFMIIVLMLNNTQLRFVSIPYYLALFVLYIIWGKIACKVLTPEHKFSPLSGRDFAFTAALFVLLVFFVAV